ncbi:MAG: hypothetical protein ACRD1T_02060 [Acidimicrobiia bacterium]
MRLFAILVALAAALTACAKQQPPGLAVKRVAADVSFGVKPAPEPATPAGVVPDRPFAAEEEFRPDLTTSGSAQQEVRCREAGPNDFPEEQAAQEVAGRPKEGVYAWKLSGKHQPTGFPFPVPLGPSTERSVQVVRPDGPEPKNFTFQTVEKDPSITSRTVITSTFRVDATNPNPRLRGIFLTQLVNDRRSGSPPSVFNPNPPVLYLALPVLQGQESAWRSVGFDTSTRQVMTHNAYVKDRFRVDACGTVLDSWLIDADQTFASEQGTSRRNYNYSIATQFGGLIIFEQSESPCAQSTAEDKCEPAGQLKYDTSIGETEPDSSRKGIR